MRMRQRSVSSARDEIAPVRKQFAEAAKECALAKAWGAGPSGLVMLVDSTDASLVFSGAASRGGRPKRAGCRAW